MVEEWMREIRSEESWKPIVSYIRWRAYLRWTCSSRPWKRACSRLYTKLVRYLSINGDTSQPFSFGDHFKMRTQCDHSSMYCGSRARSSISSDTSSLPSISNPPRPPLPTARQWSSSIQPVLKWSMLRQSSASPPSEEKNVDQHSDAGRLIVLRPRRRKLCACVAKRAIRSRTRAVVRTRMITSSFMCEVAAASHLTQLCSAQTIPVVLSCGGR